MTLDPETGIEEVDGLPHEAPEDLRLFPKDFDLALAPSSDPFVDAIEEAEAPA